MKTAVASLVACAFLAACSGNPIARPGETPANPDLPPGTDNPSPNSAIERFEERDPNTGNGFAEGFTYDADEDTFSVDGLAFDGANVYQRDNRVANLGPFQVYEGDSVYEDDVTGAPINQFGHRAIYGVSESGNVEFAVVRTGSYINYGFGGFVYRRNEGVTLPTSGQAGYTGEYAGLRDFNGIGGLEYVTGDMQMAIDFEDFNDGDGVRGRVANRQVFDLNGNNVTADVLAALSDDTGIEQTALPIMTFDVGPGVIDENGEITGQVGSVIVTDSGVEAFETGNYYAVIVGEGAEQEVAGVIVVEANEPRIDGVTVRETGGFILYRDPDSN